MCYKECMSVEETLADSFRPEERSKGSELVRKDLVVISSASDTHVKAFVKASSAAKVTLLAEEVAGSSFSAECSCPAGRKGTLCRHIWAVLLKLETKQSDFLEGKVQIEGGEPAAPSPAAIKQSEYKKQQYEKQKARAKEIRREKKEAASGSQVTFPEPVQEALDYFRVNGFPLNPPDSEGLQNAKKLLARVFHPDKGGSHEEILELNANFEIVQDYLNS